MIRLHTDDGASIAVHAMAGRADMAPLLISHATGFHARCYQPVADALGDRFCVFGIDHRGHGDSTAPPGWSVDWHRFGVDTLEVARTIAPEGGLVGIGHSMGGASLLMAAHAAPDMFSHLVLFEPIAHPPRGSGLTGVEMRSLPIVQGALRRRRRFPSKVTAHDNYASKPPMSQMTPEVLTNYVEHGFRDVIGDDGIAEVELCCAPEFEADIFMGGRDNGVWELLHEVETPCTVIGGHVEAMQPSASTEQIADELPAGRYLLLAHQTHFGPFSHPDELAALVP